MGIVSIGLTLSACGNDARRDAPVVTAATPPAQQGPAPSAATCGFPDFTATALARINRARAAGANCRSEGKFGPARALTWNDRLARSAALHTRDMATHNFFSHIGRDGRNLSQRVDAAGYAWGSIGENIDAGSTSVPGAIDSWMASDHHCANIMNPTFTEVGLACVRGGPSNTYVTYWTMNLGKPQR